MSGNEDASSSLLQTDGTDLSYLKFEPYEDGTVTLTVTKDIFETVTNVIYNSIPVTLTNMVKTTLTRPVSKVCLALK